MYGPEQRNTWTGLVEEALVHTPTAKEWKYVDSMLQRYALQVDGIKPHRLAHFRCLYHDSAPSHSKPHWQHTTPDVHQVAAICMLGTLSLTLTYVP